MKHEVSEITYRNEPFKYVHFFYECDDTKEHFTTTELDEINMEQVYMQYQTKHGMSGGNIIKDAQ